MRVTFKPMVFAHRKRKDNTFSVTIRIGLNSKYSYIETDFSVSNKDLNRKGEIKNNFILSKCHELIDDYKGVIKNIEDGSNFTAIDVKEFILTKQGFEDGLHFIKLFKKYMVGACTKPSWHLYNTTYNHLLSYAGNEVMVNDVTPQFLMGFQRYLEKRGVGSRGINLYLSRVRSVFNWIMDEYEYKGYEFRYPFRAYKLPKPVQRRPVSLTREQIRAIMDINLKGVRANRARDVFIISLLTCGTNAKDLYMLDKITNRIEYERSKTRSRRDDNAFISIKVEPELLPYIERCKGNDRGFIFSEWYATAPKFNDALWSGLKGVIKQVRKKHGEDFIHDIVFYDARRTVSSIMRNKLGISVDDVAMVLNHKSTVNRITDLYIEVDFSIIHRANRKFIDWVYEL